VFDDLPPFMTVPQAAKLLQIGRTRAYELTTEWEATGGRVWYPVRPLRLAQASTAVGSHQALRRTAGPLRLIKLAMTADRNQCRHSLLLGPMADETRRSLGPLAWAALETLVTDSRPIGDIDVADTSVRQLADRLGVAKNTAHRALTALRGAGFIEPLQSRSASGQFASGSYRLAVASAILRLAAEIFAVPSASAPPSAVGPSPSLPSRRVPAPSRQLSLLPSV